MDNLSFLGPILGGAIAALLGFVATLMVETWRHRKKKVAIIRALHREIKHNNSIIQDMVQSGWRSGADSASPFERLQTLSYSKVRESGIMATFSGPLYDKLSSVYHMIFEIHRLRNEGYRIQGVVDKQTFNVVAMAGGHHDHCTIAGLAQLPRELSELEENFQTAFPFVRNK